MACSVSRSSSSEQPGRRRSVSNSVNSWKFSGLKLSNRLVQSCCCRHDRSAQEPPRRTGLRCHQLQRPRSAFSAVVWLVLSSLPNLKRISHLHREVGKRPMTITLSGFPAGDCGSPHSIRMPIDVSPRNFYARSQRPGTRHLAASPTLLSSAWCPAPV
jgi:hypothetical protein